MEGLPAYFTGFLAVLLLTGFVKILTTLNILRVGLGLHGASFGVVTLGLSLALAVVVSTPELNSLGVKSPFELGQINQSELQHSFGEFMLKNTDKAVKTRFDRLAQKLAKPAQENTERPTSFSLSIVAFMLSELKEAFQLGFILLIPFVVIDLLVTNVLMLLGVSQLAPQVISFPLKLLLFFVVDGWNLLAEKLVSSYI